MKLRRKATCNKCRKEFQGVTHLKLHMNNAHTEMTRAKPRVSDKSSRLVTTIPSTLHPPGIETDSIPALTYDADSELLLDSEESEQEVIEENEYFTPARPEIQEAAPSKDSEALLTAVMAPGGLHPAPDV